MMMDEAWAGRPGSQTQVSKQINQMEAEEAEKEECTMKPFWTVKFTLESEGGLKHTL